MIRPFGQRGRWLDPKHFRDVIHVLVVRDQKARYKSTLMGVVWAVVSPMLFLLTFYLMFQVILPLDIPNYASHVVIGVVAWIWFQSTIQESVSVIVANPGLVRQPRFPNAALPIAATTSNFITLLLSCPLLIVIVLLEGSRPGLPLLALPIVLFTQFVLILSVSYFVAALNVSFRDMQYIVPIILQLGYFTTPIFYDLSLLSERGRDILAFNPMLQVIGAYRDILMLSEWPNWGALGLVLLGSLGMLIVTFRFFERASLRFLEDM